MKLFSTKTNKPVSAALKTGAMALLSLLLSPITHAENQLSVLLPAEQITLSYPQPVRLEQVFNDAISHSKATSPLEFPLANQLINLDKQTQAEEFKQNVLTQIVQQLRVNNSKQSLIKQVTNWQVGYRELISLDFDVIRSQANANPMLSGNFEFVTNKRSATISIEGLVVQPQALKFKADSSLSDYIQQVNESDNVHPSYAWVIYPDGHFVRAGYAIWNNENIQLTPNSVIFLGSNSDSAETIKLEEQIVTLITMRKNAQ
ncbi:capsule biosynthesis GfcC family protein [Vibrio ponticus]|nr:capsule biosynthesis GfcC family protein [Vibrio ponticus]